MPDNQQVEKEMNFARVELLHLQALCLDMKEKEFKKKDGLANAYRALKKNTKKYFSQYNAIVRSWPEYKRQQSNELLQKIHLQCCELRKKMYDLQYRMINSLDEKIKKYIEKHLIHTNLIKNILDRAVFYEYRFNEFARKNLTNEKLTEEDKKEKKLLYDNRDAKKIIAFLKFLLRKPLLSEFSQIRNELEGNSKTKSSAECLKIYASKLNTLKHHMNNQSLYFYGCFADICSVDVRDLHLRLNEIFTHFNRYKYQDHFSDSMLFVKPKEIVCQVQNTVEVSKGIRM